MDVRGRRGLFTDRRGWVLACAAAVLPAVALAASPASASAAPEKTDVMFLLDTSGSMGSELAEAKEKVVHVMETVRSHLPNVAFGVANVEDIPGYLEGSFTETLSEQQYAERKEKAWRLDRALTSEPAAVLSAIEALTIGGGGDGPEAYARALWETDTNPTVGWRAGARHEIVLVADNVPHDPNLNEGLPESEWVSNPFNTFEEPPGQFGIAGTVWTAGTNLRIRAVASQLGADGKPLQSVEFFGATDGYLHYWEYWAGLSGGQALNGGSGELESALTKVIETGAAKSLAPCPAGQVRNGEEACIVPSKPTSHPTVTQVICNLIVASASDTCTATVGDAASSGQTNPTGTVTFTSSSGGVFSAGNTCNLSPSPGTASSCSVQYLPPTMPASLPAITATYSGDSTHNSSSGQTHYGAASELAKEVSLSDLGTIHEGTVSVPVGCGFPCDAGGSLTDTPSTANLASVAVLEGAIASHGKKKFKPKVIGTGRLKLTKPGKGTLVIKLSSKARHVLGKLGANGVALTLSVTVTTANGTPVTTKKELIRVKPQARKKKKKG